MKLCHLFVLIALLMPSLARAAEPEILPFGVTVDTLYATLDSWAKNTYSAWNRSALTSVAVGDSAGSIRIAFMRFDLSGIEQPVHKAQLTMFFNGTAGLINNMERGDIIGVHRVLKDWNESMTDSVTGLGAYWSQVGAGGYLQNYASIGGGGVGNVYADSSYDVSTWYNADIVLEPFATFGPDSARTAADTIKVDVTDYARKVQDGQWKDYGVAFKLLSASDAADNVRISSSEITSAWLRPFLLVWSGPIAGSSIQRRHIGSSGLVRR